MNKEDHDNLCKFLREKIAARGTSPTPGALQRMPHLIRTVFEWGSVDSHELVVGNMNNTAALMVLERVGLFKRAHGQIVMSKVLERHIEDNNLFPDLV